MYFQAAEQSMQHVSVLTAVNIHEQKKKKNLIYYVFKALNNAQTASEHAQQSANEASAELASQTQVQYFKKHLFYEN